VNKSLMRWNELLRRRAATEMRRATGHTTLAATLALLAALLVAAVGRSFTWPVATAIDECASAELAIGVLLHSLAESPQAAAASLSEAFATQKGDANSLLPAHLRPRGKCPAFENMADKLLRFMQKLHSSVQAPSLKHRVEQQQSLRQQPRVLVVGAGPAGLPAALVAHREGAFVTIIEQRTSRTRCAPK
jgi:hypothetical protein